MRIRMQRYGVRGWSFTIDGTKYHTDNHGGGLWQNLPALGVIYPPDCREFRQIVGTCQFTLSGDRSRAYQQIRRGFVA